MEIKNIDDEVLESIKMTTDSERISELKNAPNAAFAATAAENWSSDASAPAWQMTEEWRYFARIATVSNTAPSRKYFKPQNITSAN